MKATHILRKDIVINTHKCKLMLLAYILFLLTSVNFVHAQEIIDEFDSTLIKQENSIDSLYQQVEGTFNRVNSPINKVSKKADSLSQLLNVDQKINQEIDKKESEVNQLINKQKQVGETKDALNNIENETGLSGPNGSMADLPGLEQSELNLTNQPSLSDSGLPTDKLQEIKSLPSHEIDKLKSLKEVEQATEHIGKVKEIGDVAGTYKKEVEAISQGNLNKVKQLPQTAEQTLAGTKEIKALQEQEANLKQIQAHPQELKEQVNTYTDQEFLKQKAKEKLLEKSKDHFTHHTGEVQSAQKKLSKLKRKYSQVNSSSGKLVKRTSLKGKPFKERLTGGFTLQIHQGPPTAFDVSPFIGYLFSKRWSTGIGGTYRLAFNEENLPECENPVYGVKWYTEYRPYKKFLLHGEYEYLKLTVPSQTISVDNATHQWVDGLLVGGGKSYKVSKKINGSVLMLYNLIYLNSGSYKQKWNIRFGFYI